MACLSLATACATNGGSLPSLGPPCPDGEAEHLVRVIFGWPSDLAGPEGRWPALQTSILEAVTLADAYLAASGPGHHINWACTSEGALAIEQVSLSPVGDDGVFSFAEAVESLQEAGYDQTTELYLLFIEPFHLGYGHVGEATTGPGAPQYAMVTEWSGYWALHETGHMLGAVPGPAPNQGFRGHCIEQYDIMCRSEHDPVMNCPDGPAWQFDCNHDDYYMHDGDWWDVADSPFVSMD